MRTKRSMDRVTLICPVCDNPFSVPHAQGAYRIYCSYPCARVGISRAASARVKSGVYAIVHVDSGRAYVGSSVNTGDRLKLHRWQLKKNLSPHRSLQEAWIQYGKDSFELRVLEEVADTATLIDREHAWIEKFRSGPGAFNLRPHAGSPLGIKHRPETLEKWGRGKLGGLNPSAKLTDEDVTEIRRRLSVGETGTAIARSYGVSKSVVSLIKLGRRGRLGKRSTPHVRSSRTVTPDQVRSIRFEAAAGIPRKEISKRYNVSRSTISLLLAGKTYASVT